MTTYNFTINLEEYTILQKLKKTELDQICKTIFKNGYETIFPTKQSSDPLVGKIASLESTLERLMGIGSSKKGEMAELVLSSHIKSRYGDVSYNDMSHTPHSGDAHINFDGCDTTIMLESKNYTTKVNNDEVDKMKMDMINTNIKWGIFLSWNSNIIDKREFDIEIFHDKTIQYHIIYVSNLSSDIDRLDLAIMLIRRLIHYSSGTNTNVLWIHSMIQNNINELNTIIMKNYMLRVWFDEMENNMNQQMNKFYTRMRDYMFEMDMHVKKIVESIVNTTSLSLEINHDIYNTYLEQYKDNKKLFPTLSKLVDIFKEYSILIQDDNIMKNNIIIGTIKIMGKKITVNWTKYKHTSCLDHEGNIESFNMIRLFCTNT